MSSKGKKRHEAFLLREKKRNNELKEAIKKRNNQDIIDDLRYSAKLVVIDNCDAIKTDVLKTLHKAADKIESISISMENILESVSDLISWEQLCALKKKNKGEFIDIGII